MSVRKGTAVREKGQERVEVILGTALALLVEDGYAGLSLRKISTSAGLHLGHVQYYFPTKQDLLRAMLERWLAMFRATVSRKLDQHTAALDRLLDLVDLSLRDMRTPMGSIMIWEIWALAPRDPFVAELMDKLYVDLRREYRNLLMEHDPTLSARRSQLVAGALSALVEGASLYVGHGKRRHRSLAGLHEEIIRSARLIVEGSAGD